MMDQQYQTLRRMCDQNQNDIAHLQAGVEQLRKQIAELETKLKEKP